MTKAPVQERRGSTKDGYQIVINQSVLSSQGEFPYHCVVSGNGQRSETIHRTAKACMSTIRTIIGKAKITWQ